MTAVEESNIPGIGAKPSRPTVLQVLPSLEVGGGGVERGTIDISLALANAGYGSLVASGGGMLVRELERGGVRHFTLPLMKKNPLAIRRNTDHLVRIIREHGVDIVHARSRAPAWSADSAARRTGAHFVSTFHGTYSGTRNFVKKHYNSIMTRGEKVIAISHFIAEHIRTVYGVEEQRIRVIHRGIDLERFDPRNVSAERVVHFANEWRLPDGVPVVMLPGRLTRWKGQTMMIEALARLGRHDIRCLLVGSDQGRTGYRRELERLVERKGLSDVVHIADHCADMPAAYMLTDVVVSASSDPEAFGRVIAEAQAMGCPVVATDHGGARETLHPKKTGWLIPPGDAEALADILNLALSLGTGEREALAEMAVANIRKNFSKEKMCERTIAVYEEVMAGKDGKWTPRT